LPFRKQCASAEELLAVAAVVQQTKEIEYINIRRQLPFNCVLIVLCGTNILPLGTMSPSPHKYFQFSIYLFFLYVFVFLLLFYYCKGITIIIKLLVVFYIVWKGRKKIWNLTSQDICIFIFILIYL